MVSLRVVAKWNLMKFFGKSAGCGKVDSDANSVVSLQIVAKGNLLQIL